MSTALYSGGCLCGALRYEVAGPVGNPCFCHCASCRRAAGAASVPWGTFARQGLTITRGQLTEYRSSPGVWRGFCVRCGSSLTYRREDRAAEIDVTLTTLDDPTLIAPRMHVWVAERLPWVVIADGLPQLPAGTGG